MRLIIAISVQHHWKIKTTAIKSAFLQGKQITRDVYIQPQQEKQVDIFGNSSIVSTGYQRQHDNFMKKFKKF